MLSFLMKKIKIKIVAVVVTALCKTFGARSRFSSLNRRSQALVPEARHLEQLSSYKRLGLVFGSVKAGESGVFAVYVELARLLVWQ